MGVRTRSVTGSPVKGRTAASTSMKLSQHLQSQPVKLLIAPKCLSPDARIISLKHPQDNAIRQFIFCVVSGLYELTRISGTKLGPRSVLLTPQNCSPGCQTPTTSLEGQTVDQKEGMINAEAEYLTATPFDLPFLLLRFLAPLDNSTKKQMFQPLDDLLEISELEEEHLQFLLRTGRSRIEAAMIKICDTVDAGGENMYRLSEDKLSQWLLEKAQRVVSNGLPVSVEERFVSRVLEAPVLNVRREEGSAVTQPTGATPSEAAVQDEPSDSQSTGTTPAPSFVFSETSATNTSVTVPDDDIPSDVLRLQRLRVALNFMLTSYLPRPLAQRLPDRWSTEKSPIDFKPLDDHLARLASLRAEVAASRSFSDFSRKRSQADDEELAAERAEKRRRLEADEKRRKANESRGVRDLKKVNVSGMKKMSQFFAKKPAATAK